MTIRLRNAEIHEQDALTEICMRSKAHWGYDPAFMKACRPELTIRDSDFEESHLQVIEVDGKVVAVAQLGHDGDDAEVWKLFVAPEFMGRGHGRRLMDWMVDVARSEGAVRLRIEADPGAVPFYERCGAIKAGEAPSGSIPGRSLPLLYLAL